jgi:hypothetical protein
MQRRRNQHRVDVSAGQSRRLSTAGPDVHSGQSRAELCAHGGRGLDSDYLQAPLDEIGGELAGAGAEIENSLGVSREQPGDRVGGVAGTRALVQRSC